MDHVSGVTVAVAYEIVDHEVTDHLFDEGFVAIAKMLNEYCSLIRTQRCGILQMKQGGMKEFFVLNESGGTR